MTCAPRSTGSRARRALSALRPAAADLATPEGRASSRHRRVTLAVVGSAGAKLVKLLTSLIAVPLTVEYLGTERYGLWMTVSSVVAILAFADLGMGNGLLNAVAEASGHEDRAMAADYVSSAFFMLLCVALAVALAAALWYPWINWGTVFNVTSPAAVAEAGPAIAVLLGCLVVSLPFGVVQRVQLGLQEGFVNSLWEALGSLLGLTGVLLAIDARAGLPWLVLGMAGGPAAALVVNAIVLFGWRRRWLRPRWGRVARGPAARILRLGASFFVLQAVMAAAFFSDNLVAARLLGAAAVAQYAVPQKLFEVVGLVAGMFLGPLWPAYSEAIARGDLGWVKRTLRRSLAAAAVLTGGVALALVLSGGAILRLWAGPSITPTPLLLAGLGVWVVLSNIGTALAMFLNGANAVRLQVVCAVLMGGTALVLKIVLTQRVGIAGLVWATVIAYLMCTLLPLGTALPRLLSTLESRRARPATV
jgi:O-antigen/teichoic acid export membrane protein